MHRARAQMHLMAPSSRKESALLNLNIAISTILAQGSAIKQCRPLVIKAPMPWHKLLSLELCVVGGLEGVWLRQLIYEVCVSKDFCE